MARPTPLSRATSSSAGLPADPMRMPTSMVFPTSKPSEIYMELLAAGQVVMREKGAGLWNRLPDERFRRAKPLPVDGYSCCRSTGTFGEQTGRHGGGGLEHCRPFYRLRTGAARAKGVGA